MSSGGVRGVLYRKHGDPRAVLREEDLPDPGAPGEGEVRLRMLAAPINPADLNMVEGTYSLLPPLPAVGGNEGVAVVEAVGSGTVSAAACGASLAEGDLVIPAEAGFGTWRTHAVCAASEVARVPAGVPLHVAATVAVNPCTAYRMLRDFVALEPGAVVAQNGATSGVGTAVIQLARAMGVRTVNLVRDRDDPARMEKARAELTALGADVVLSDSEVAAGAARGLFAADGGLPRPLLALNCVGGRSATELSRMLGSGGQMVTYGGMSRKPVMLPTGPLIFKDLSFRGFWMTRWTAEHSPAERGAMINDILEAAARGEFTALCEEHPFADLSGALARHYESYRGRKVLLRF